MVIRHCIKYMQCLHCIGETQELRQMKVFRIYNDIGYPEYQCPGTPENLSDKMDYICEIARKESMKKKATVISVWYCETNEDVLVEDGDGIINEGEELVIEYFEGRVCRE